MKRPQIEVKPKTQNTRPNTSRRGTWDGRFSVESEQRFDHVIHFEVDLASSPHVGFEV